MSRAVLLVGGYPAARAGVRRLAPTATSVATATVQPTPVLDQALYATLARLLTAPGWTAAP